ncbi:MAG: tryptophan-rich sensory protein [Clostridia bacterium]|nr:tryptophan-rich sensory protein [Clostridia bacterium]
MEKKHFIKTNIITNIIIILVAVLGSVFVNLGMEWYATLVKPTEWVPSAVFGIVWTIIYVLTAITLFVWQKNSKVPTLVYVLFIINGILNVLWCLVFFTLNQLLLGAIIILLNLIFAFWLIVQVYKNNWFYGLLIAIYPVWISIATSLNLATWILN